jgi:predicted anti-sigma-YlaC factor YlaD
MNGRKLHCTTEQFNVLLDGRVIGAEEKDIRDHISVCTECRLAFENLERIDTALCGLPVMETRPDFTRSLMERMLAAPKSPFLFRLLEKISYIFGLFIVLGIMIGAFILSGVFEAPQIERTKSVATGMVDKAGEGLASSIGAFTSMLVQYIPFAFGKGSMGVAFFAVAIVIMLAFVDRLLGRKIVQRLN